MVATMSDEDYVFTRQMFPTHDLFDLMKRKGIFPHDFFESMSKLYYDEFPSRTTFYNKLEKECSVWITFKCKSFRQYHNLYLKSDVLLLADFFEKFRRACTKSYGLDAAHCYSAPVIAWEAALKLNSISSIMK